MLIGDQEFYRTKEACSKAGISKATFHRWIKQGVIKDNFAKDRRGWRLFSESDIEKIRIEVFKVSHEVSES